LNSQNGENGAVAVAAEIGLMSAGAIKVRFFFILYYYISLKA
jgi:hypothetical protein